MPPTLTFHGAAGEVTGSMHLLEAAGARVLLDAGLVQGKRAEARARNAELPFDPRMLDAIVVSHAHIDHTGRLPLLVRHGFHGPVYTTPATRDLCAVMLADSAMIQQKDAEFLARRGRAGPASAPLYDLADATAVQELMVGVPYRRPIHLRRNLVLEYFEAGHILGSATVDLRLHEAKPHRLVFSGDIGRSGLPIIRDPDPPAGPVDTLIIESTYGNRRHAPIAGAEAQLAELVRQTAARGGKVLIPSFAVGRTQELVYALHELWRHGRIPHLPVYIDSPLALDVTSVFRMHPEVFDRRERLLATENAPFDFPLVTYVRSVEESKRLNRLNGPAIIIAASGMAESGRILHHLANGIGDHRNLVLFVGFQAEHTLGRRLQEERSEVRIFGETHTRRAAVATLEGYSAHADREELRAWVRKLGGPVRRAFCVHGEEEGLLGMADLLREEGVHEVIVPRRGERFELGE